jgi:hypothetical protein
MRQTQGAQLETPIGGLHATPAAPLPFARNLRARSFLLERPQGNLLVYNSPGLTTAANAIRTAGGATRLFINHGHEAMIGTKSLVRCRSRARSSNATDSTTTSR